MPPTHMNTHGPKRNALAPALGAALAAMCFAPGGVVAQEVARTTTDLSLRAGPSTQYQRLTVMPGGARVDIERCTPGYGWCELNYRGYNGWASANYLVIPGAPANRPLAQAQISIDLPIFDFFSRIGGGGGDGGGDDDGGGDTAPDIGANEVCFYADFDYGGDSFCASRGEANASLPSAWNDRISSIRTGSNTGVFVCEHTGFDGSCRRVAGNVESFSGDWNDVISSYEVGQRGDGGNGDDGDGDGDGREIGANEICFYENFNYGGSSTCTTMGQQNPRLGSTWNDAISSIRVGANAVVQVCEDFGYDGNCQRIRADVSQLSGGWNDTISSYRAGMGAPGNGGDGGGDDGNGGGDTAEVCFYEDFDYGGNSTCAAPGESQPRLGGDWNDAISSIRVSGGAQLQVCEDFEYGGNCQRINDDVGSLSESWNDAISSYRVR